MTLRLFSAILVPPSLGERLLLLRRDLPGVRWREQESFHITLAFFGEVEHETARELDELLAAHTSPPLSLRLEGIGWFGRKEPTAIWAGVAANEGLNRLAAMCERAARHLGLDMPRRKYSPHVTLGYCAGAELAEIGAYQNAMRDFRTEAFEVQQFELYSSHRTGGQNRYDEEATYPLTGY